MTYKGLKRMMVHLGYTGKGAKARLAADVRVERQTVYKWLNDERKIPEMLVAWFEAQCKIKELKAQLVKIWGECECEAITNPDGSI